MAVNGRVVVLAAGVVVSLVGGAVAATDGGIKMAKAKRMANGAQARHEKALEKFLKVEERVQTRTGVYGQHQLKVQAETLGAWVEWLEENEHKVKRLDRAIVDGVEVQVPDIPRLKLQVVQSVELLKGGIGAAAGAYAVHSAALWGVTAYATASTGTAISGLSGAAATNATLAWLGGGSLAVGGGGVALGGIMLTGIAIAPAALVGGFAVGIQGHQALTKATEIEAGVDVAIAEMAQKEELLAKVETRIGELQDVLTKTSRRAMKALGRLRKHDFDPDKHLEDFQQVALLMRAVGEILSTPIVDPDGSPSSESLRVREKYAR